MEIGDVVSGENDRPKTVTKQQNNDYQKVKVSSKPKSSNCYICGKEFLLSSLKIHEKQCEKKQETLSSTNKSSATKKVVKKPQFETCYLCGKKFPSRFLGVHETQCIKAWKSNRTPDAKDKPISDKNFEHVVVSLSNKNTLSDSTKEDNVEYETVESTNKDLPVPTNNCVRNKGKGLKTIPCGVAYLPHSLKIHEKKCLGLNKTSTVAEQKEIKTEQSMANFTGKLPCDLNNIQNVEYVSEKPSEELLKSPYLKHEKKCFPQSLEVASGSEDLPHNESRLAAKPKTIICYICGKEFLKASYKFHEKKCASKHQNAFDDKGLTRKDQIEDEKSSHCQTQKKTPNTQPCYICGKEVLSSSIHIHEQQCQKKAELLKNANKQKSSLKTKQTVTPMKNKTTPKTKSCYICGQTCLLSSIKFHERQCEKKWNKE